MRIKLTYAEMSKFMRLYTNEPNHPAINRSDWERLKKYLLSERRNEIYVSNDAIEITNKNGEIGWIMSKKLNPSLSPLITFILSEGERKMTLENEKDWNSVCSTTTQIGYSVGSVTNCTQTFAETLSDLNKKYDKLYEQLDRKEDKDMDGNPMVNFNMDFGPVNSDAIRMSMYGLAVRNAAGTFVAYDPKGASIMDVEAMNFPSEKFMFKMPVALKAVAVGDIIIHNRTPMFVTDVTDTSFKVVDVREGSKKEIIPTKNMFGFNFVTKVVSMIDLSSASADSPFGNLMPLMMIQNMGNGDDMNPMAMMFAMQSMNGGKMDMSNPMMAMLPMLAMNNNGGNNNNFMQMFAMMQYAAMNAAK